jgi:hypothetical protein
VLVPLLESVVAPRVDDAGVANPVSFRHSLEWRVEAAKMVPLVTVIAQQNR